MVLGAGAWVGAKSLNSVSNGTDAAYDSSLYLVGTNTNWDTNKIQLQQSDGDPSDKGMARGVSFTAGDIFRISNPTSGWNVNYGYPSLNSGSSAYSSFDRYVKGNLMYTISTGGVSKGTYASGTVIMCASNFTIYLTANSWWSDSCHFGFRSFNNSTVYVGTKVTGSYGTPGVVIRFDLDNDALDGGFQFVRIPTSKAEGAKITNYSDTIHNYSSNVCDDADATLALFTEGTDDNIYVKTTGAYDVYLNNSGAIYINAAQHHITRHALFFKGSFYQGTDQLSTQNVTPGGTYTYSTAADWPNGYDYSGTTYRFAGVYTTGNTTTGEHSGLVTGSTTPSGDITLYELFTDQNTYTVTFKYVVDGVLQTQIGDGTISGVVCGTAYTSLAEPTLYGCSFDGWYGNEACTEGLTEVIGNRTVYAKFTSDNSGHTFYLDVPSSEYGNMTVNSDGVYYSYVHYFYPETNSTRAQTIKVKEVTAISITNNKYFAFHVPDDAASFFLYNGSQDNVSYRTENLYPGAGADATRYANGHNVYVVGPAGGGEGGKHDGSWADVMYYAQVCTDKSFDGSKTTVYNMSVPNDASTGNAAEKMNVAVPANGYLRYQYAVVYSDNTETRTGVTVGGVDEHFTPAEWGYVSQQTEGAKFSAAKTINLYIAGSGKDYGKMFIVDCSGIEGAGYIYISSQYAPAELKVTCSVNGVTKFSSAKVSTVDGTKNASALTFGGIKGMTKVSLYNLKKEVPLSTDTYSITLANSDGSKTTNVTGVTIPSEGTNNYILVLNSGAAWSASTAVTTTNVNAAIVAFDIAMAIKGNSHTSVCDIDDKTAGKLCDAYDVSAVKTLLESSSTDYGITSWDGNRTTTRGTPVYAGEALAQFKYIRYELGLICNKKTPYPYPSKLGFLPGSVGESNPLTTTLWIVLASGLAGLAAIGTAYVVSKKKRHQA